MQSQDTLPAPSPNPPSPLPTSPFPPSRGADKEVGKNHDTLSAARGSGRAKRETAKGRNRTRIAHFADFCRFSLIFGSLCKSRDLGAADLRRKPQETADFRRKSQRKPQIFAETGLSHLLSPFWRAPRGPQQERPPQFQNGNVRVKSWQ